MKQALEMLAPNTCWAGTNGNKDYFEAEIIGGKKWKVDMKRNYRKETAKCRVFDTVQEAENYLYQHIAETTFS